MKEIITLQIGSLSNFIGSHYWNIQDQYCNRYEKNENENEEKDSELDMNMLFRTGISENNTTLTPRLIAIDYGGSLGSMPEAGFLYGKSNKSNINNSFAKSTWDGNLQIAPAESIPRTHITQEVAEFGNYMRGDSETFDFSNNSNVEILSRPIKYWSDYLNIPLHSKTNISLPSYKMDTTDFFYPDGVVEASGTFLEESYDSVRFFAEECDSMQGIQVIFDSKNGFGGVAHKYLELLNDDFTAPIFTLAASDCNMNSNNLSLVSDCIAAVKISELSSIYVPLCTSKVAESFSFLDSSKYYEISSILAASWNGALSPCRLSKSNICFSNLIQTVKPYSNLKFGHLSFAFLDKTHTSKEYFSINFHLEPNGIKLESKDGYLAFHKSKYLTQLSGIKFSNEDRLIGEWATVHGYNEKLSVFKNRFEEYLYHFNCMARNETIFENTFSFPKSFPDSFTKEDTSIVTDLFTSYESIDYIKDYSKLFNSLIADNKILHQFIKNGAMANDEFVEIKNSYSDLIESYTV